MAVTGYSLLHSALAVLQQRAHGIGNVSRNIKSSMKEARLYKEGGGGVRERERERGKKRKSWFLVLVEGRQRAVHSHLMQNGGFSGGGLMWC